jgi:glycosyltransferase involved in cell wall biosynthesis
MNTAIRALILSPDPARQGGVRDFVETFKSRLGPDVEAERFVVGRGTGGLSSLLGAVVDAVRLFARLATQPDVVHLNPSLNKAIVREALAMLALRLRGARNVLVFIHGWDLGWEKRIDDSRFWRWLLRTAYGRSACIVVLAGRFRDRLVGWGFDPRRIRVMSTFFEGGQFDGLSRTRDDEQVQLLFLSRFVRAKGGYEVIEAFARLAGDYPGLRLICAGDGPDAEGMKALAQRLGVADRVDFPGFVSGEAKARLLLDSDVFAFPTYYGEGCPVSLLEAMAAGMAVLTAEAGGIPEVFRDGENGVLLRQVSADTVEQGLRRLLADPTARRAVGERNRQQAWARFEAGPVSAQLVGLYREVVAASAKGSRHSV